MGGTATAESGIDFSRKKKVWFCSIFHPNFAKQEPPSFWQEAYKISKNHPKKVFQRERRLKIRSRKYTISVFFIALWHEYIFTVDLCRITKMCPKTTFFWWFLVQNHDFLRHSPKRTLQRLGTVRTLQRLGTVRTHQSVLYSDSGPFALKKRCEILLIFIVFSQSKTRTRFGKRRIKFPKII